MNDIDGQKFVGGGGEASKASKLGGKLPPLPPPPPRRLPRPCLLILTSLSAAAANWNQWAGRTVNLFILNSTDYDAWNIYVSKTAVYFE